MRKICWNYAIILKEEWKALSAYENPPTSIMKLNPGKNNSRESKVTDIF